VISTSARCPVSQYLISRSSLTVHTITLIWCRRHCPETPARASRRSAATQVAPHARRRDSGRSSLTRVRSHVARGDRVMSRPSDSATGTASASPNSDLMAATEASSSVVMMNSPGPRMSSARRTTASSPPVTLRSRWPLARPLIAVRMSAASGTS